MALDLAPTGQIRCPRRKANSLLPSHKVRTDRGHPTIRKHARNGSSKTWSAYYSDSCPADATHQTRQINSIRHAVRKSSEVWSPILMKKCTEQTCAHVPLERRSSPCTQCVRKRVALQLHHCPVWSRNTRRIWSVQICSNQQHQRKIGPTT